MTVEQFIFCLSKFPPGYKVTITDGYNCLSYEGNFIFQDFEGSLDIGIGGCEYRGE